MVNGIAYTGDETQIVGYVIVGVLALVAVVAVLILTRPKKTEDENSDEIENSEDK